jgi:SAM-dependent methyltransferase
VLASRDGVPLLAPALADTPAGFDPAAFDALSKIEDGHFWFAPRNALIVGLANKYFPNAGSFLEIGCGTGAVLNAVAQARNWQRVVGSELHPAGLDIARRRLGARAEFVQMDARVPAVADSFDLIGAFDVLEHIADDDAVLSAAQRALRAGGGLILAVPQHPSLWSGADDAAHHVRRYRRGELEEKAAAAGFRVLFSGSYMVSLLPIMAASRVFQRNKMNLRAQSAAVELGAEYHLSRPINAMLRGILRLEVASILAGMRYPVGGSRVVVATKT